MYAVLYVKNDPLQMYYYVHISWNAKYKLFMSNSLAEDTSKML